MKKLVYLLAAVAVLATALLTTACDNRSDAYEQGLEVIAMMRESADHTLNYNTNIGDFQEQLEQVQNGVYTAPKAVYRLSVSDKSLATILNYENFDKYSDTFKSFLRSRAYSLIATQINAGSGADNVAASSYCSAEKLFVDKTLTESITYLYVFENGPSAVIGFSVGEDGAVSAKGYFLFNEEFHTDSAETIISYFKTIDVMAEVITP